MTCYSPITLYRSREGRSENGKWKLTGLRDGYKDLKEKLPCGRCIGCRLEYSRQWAVRCVHEAQMHEGNMFVTLTYRDEELVFGVSPDGIERPVLYPRHLQLFLKRYRKEYGNGIRFFACGEYGEQYNRPHYHAIIFGHDIPDKVYDSTTPMGDRLYHSDSLDNLWGHGTTIIGDVSFESAAYVARYVVDKKLGFESSFYREHNIEPEFVRMSRRSGIGLSWLEKFESDVFPGDKCVVRNGIVTRPPKYYAIKYGDKNPESMERIKAKRKIAMLVQDSENDVWRLRVREKIKQVQVASLKR